MVLIMIACILVMIIIMAQNPKGGGLSSAFGGTSSAQFGVQRTNDFMEKSTWILGGTIAVLCLISVVMTTNPQAVNKSTPKVAPVENTTGTSTADKTTEAKPATTPTSEKK